MGFLDSFEKFFESLADPGAAGKLKGDSILEQWAETIDRGAGHAKDVMQKTERLIIDANMPNVRTIINDVSTGMFSERRQFLIISNDHIRGYKLLITARDFGMMLDCSWYLTLEPGYIKRALSKQMTGNPLAFSQQIDVFIQQDLRAFVTISAGLFYKVLEELVEELKLDQTILSKKSRGYLDIW
jgi:hypothetical protein